MDVEMFVESLDAALLVDEAELFAELAVWHMDYVRAADRPATTRAILDQLQDRFADADSRIGSFVDAAIDSIDLQ